MPDAKDRIVLDSTESEVGKSQSLGKGDRKAVAKPKKPGSKPRASRAGTRIVATLDAEQLARKRANDREAQRAIRQRQKDHITRLEERISELSEKSKPVESYEEVQRRNSELEEELRTLKATVFGTVPASVNLQSSSSGSGSTTQTRLASYPEPWSAQNTLNQWPPGASGFLTARPGTVFEPLAGGNPNLPLTDSGISPLDNAEAVNSMVYVNPVGGFYPSNQVAQRIPVYGALTSYERKVDEYGQEYVTNDSAPCYGDPAGTSSPGYVMRSGPVVDTIPTSFTNQPAIHMWELPLRFKPPENPFENLLFGLFQWRRSMAVGGATGRALVGATRPSLKTLFNPELPTHPLSHFLSNIIHMTTYRTIVESLGTFLVLYSCFQWHISHNLETFRNLPLWCVPTPAQISIPHTSWVSFLGWPTLRDAVIHDQARYANPEFQYLYILSVNIHWRYPLADALIFDGDDVRVTDAFWNHARDLDNWTLDAPFAERYPELRDVCKFTIDHVEKSPPGKIVT